MSYILDALRKADAERERDPARGIHAQPAAGLPLRRESRSRAWMWPAGCALAVLAAAYAFWGRSSDAVAGASHAPLPAVPVGLTTAAPLHASAATVVPVVATRVMPPPPAAVEHMAARAVLAPHAVTTPVAPTAPAAASTAATASSATSAAVAPSASTAPGTASMAPAATPTAAPAVTAPAAADRIVAVNDLPPDVQQALPKLAISGGVHSDNPAQRMLIVGGQVMTEGQELAPGVLLEQIRARSAVLRFRGYRYSVAY